MLKVTCSKSSLLAALRLVVRGVTGRSAQPVQNNIYLSAQDSRLHLVATDLELLSVETEIEVAEEDGGAVTVPGKLLIEIVAALPEGDVTLEATEFHALVVSCEGIEETVRGLSAADFQAFQVLEDATEYRLPQGQLANAIGKVAFAASNDESRPILTGVLLQVSEQGLLLAATDTYRLALYRTMGAVLGASVVVPGRVLAEVAKLLDEGSDEPATVRLTESLVSFVVGGVTVCSRLIEGEYPRYEKVIPEATERSLTVDRDALVAAVKRAGAVARADADRTVLHHDGETLEITAAAVDVGSFREVMDAELSGEPIEIAFSGKYLLDAVRALDTEKVVLGLGQPLSPATLRADNYLHVLMPMGVVR